MEMDRISIETRKQFWRYRMKKKIFTGLLLFSLSFPLLADKKKEKEEEKIARKNLEITETTKATLKAEGIDLNDKSKVPLENVILESQLILENSTEEYFLAYEAYLEARRSTSPQVVKNLAAFLKNYREAYGRFLKTMRDSKLIHPFLPKNPAGWFTEKQKKEDPTKNIYWRTPNLKDKIAKVQDLVRKGYSPKEIHAIIVSNLPVDRPKANQPADLSPNVQPFDSINNANKAVDKAENDWKAAKADPDATRDAIIKAHEKYLATAQARLATYLKLAPDEEEEIKKTREEIKSILKELEKYKEKS